MPAAAKAKPRVEAPPPAPRAVIGWWKIPDSATAPRRSRRAGAASACADRKRGTAMAGDSHRAGSGQRSKLPYRRVAAAGGQSYHWRLISRPMDVPMGAGISAMALLSTAPAHGSGTVADNHQSFRFRARVIRGALLSLDGSTARIHLSGCSTIRAGANGRGIRIDSYYKCQRGGRPEPLRTFVRRLRPPRLRAYTRN